MLNNMNSIILFCILQLINVALSVVKSIAQVKSTKIKASFVNACYYAFYTVVVIYMVADTNMWLKVIIVFITNIIGTYIAMLLLEKLRKDKLWKIEVSIKLKNVSEVEAITQDIPHDTTKLTGNFMLFNFYCRTKNETRKIKYIVEKYNAKYFISENIYNLI